MKLSEKLIRFGLIAMIILSLYLSYMIWLSPVGRERIYDSENAQISTNVQNDKPLTDLFLPTRLTWVNNEDIKETNSETLIKQVQKLVTDAAYGELTITKFPTKEALLQSLDMKHGIELSYYTSYLLADYLENNQLDMDEPANQTEDTYFSKIQFDFNEKEVLFLDFENLYVVKGSVDWNEQSVETVLKENQRDWIPMKNERLASNEQYLTKDTIRLKKYSYYSSTQSQSLFREAFFTSPKEVKINDDNVDIYYYDAGQTMTVMPEEQLVKFESTVADIHPGEDVYQQSGQYISHLGNNFGAVRLFDRNSNQLNYRVFVEGYPVFSGTMQGLIRVTFSDIGEMGNRELSIEASLNSIQVPIPSETEVELPSSSALKSELLAAGAKEDSLGAIIVGYQWEDIKDTSLVDLTPSWYINYNNEWLSYQQLMAKLTETEEK